jgi:PAS domain S-box-containing protein
MRKILAIDDQADNLATIIAVMKNHISDCAFFSALSGGEGIEIAKNEQPDVILLDIIMPEMDGYETCQKLKSNELTKHIPVILVTAIKTDSQSRIKGLNIGADAFLSKPIDASELSAQINVMFRIKKAEDELRKEKKSLNLKVNKRTNELSESEEKYRFVFEGAREGLVLFTSKLIVVDVNIAFSEITGLPSESVLGKSGFDLVNEFVGLNQIPSLLKILKDVFSKTQKKPFEVFYNNKNLEISIKRQNDGKGVGLIRDITENKKEEELLKEKEKYFRTLIENSSDVISILNNKGEVTFESSSHEKVLGYPSGELIGTSVFSLVHPDDTERILYQFKSLLSKPDGIEKVNFKFLHKLGNWVYLEGTAKNLFNSPQINGIVVNYRDVTERKQIEMSLMESELHLRRAIINSPFPVMIHAENGDVIMLSKEWTEVTGYTHAEIPTTKDWAKKAYARNFKDAFADIEKLYSIKKRVYEGCFEIKTKNNKIRFWEFMSAPLGKLPDERKVVISMALDVSERRMAENALRESERKTHTLLDNLRGIAYRCKNDENWTMEFVSAGFEEVTGYSIKDVMESKIISFKDLIIPEDRERVRKSVNKALKIKEKFEINYRLKTITGDIRYVMEKGVGILSEGKIVAFEGFITDISSEIIAEEALRKSEELNRSITQSAADAIITIDSLSRVISWNKAAEKIFGYSFEEMLNREFSKIIPSGIDINNISKQNLSDDNTNEPISENIATRQNGEQFPIEISISKWKSDNKYYFTSIIRDISVRKQSEETLTKLSTAVEQSPSVITITNLKGDIEYVNPKFTKVTGYYPNEVLGKNPRILKSGNYDNENYYSIWEKIANGEEWHGEFYNKKKNGELYWETASISPILNKYGEITNYVKVAEDITQRKRNELIQKALYNISNAVSTTASLEKLIFIIQKQLGTFIDTSNFYITFYDKQTDTFFSPFRKDTMGEAEKWPAGKSISAYVVKTSESLFIDENTLKLMIDSGDIEIVDAMPKVGMIVPLNYEGVTNGVLAIQNYTDVNAYSIDDLEMINFVSDQISLFVNRTKTMVNLKTALDKATESDRLKTAFLQNVSHEIRTPMNGILGFTNLLNDPDLSGEEKQSYINIISISGQRMLSTLNDLMDISMLETGQVKLNLTSTNINSELNNLFSFFKPEVENKGMELNHSTSLENEFVDIITDRDKFYAVLSNLIKNSIKYSKKGSINFGYELKDDFLEFYVKDNGIGIPKDRHKAIFNRFVQADIEDVKVYEGAGLGLSISKAYVKMLGGKIWVVSSLGEGSDFFFTIPYNSQNKKRVADKSNEVMSLNNENETTKLNILIVEDEEFAIEYLSIILGVLNPILLFAKTGIEAINICKENPDIDLILMDIKMPIMGGYEATREIRKFNENVVIIAQTAFALGGDREKAIKAGCNDYVTKPIDSNILMSKINSYFPISNNLSMVDK